MLKHIILLISVTALIVFSILFMVERSNGSEQRISFELNDTDGKVATHGSAMHQLASAEKQQPSSISVQAVFISVDHLRDNAQSLNRYIKFFHPNYIGYLGNTEQLDQVTKSFNVAYSATLGQDDIVDVLHSSQIYITNPYGRLVKQLPYGSSTDLIVSEVRSLM